jgi:diacylglycerol kinase family enzyme
LPTKRGALFLNPSAGAKLAVNDESAIEAAAKEGGLDVFWIDHHVDCVSIIREQMSMGRKLFIAGGGDGTISNVIQPLVNSEAVLGVLPLGTFNHFARDLGLPLDWRAALEIALSGTTRQIDTARVNERFFVNNLSIGLYPELVARREARGRDTSRWKARIYAAIATLRKYPYITLTIETEHHHEVISTHVFVVSNNSYDLSRLGVEAPRITLEEGRLSVYWLPHVRRIELMRFLAHYFAGRVTTTPGFRSFRTVRLRMQSPRKHLHLGIDGEFVKMPPPLIITMVPQSLLVKVPRE